MKTRYFISETGESIYKYENGKVFYRRIHADYPWIRSGLTFHDVTQVEPIYREIEEPEIALL